LTDHVSDHVAAAVGHLNFKLIDDNHPRVGRRARLRGAGIAEHEIGLASESLLSNGRAGAESQRQPRSGPR
jgi:hypothetical protein